MVKTLAIAALVTVVGLSLSSIASAASAKDPSAGQSSSELNSLSPRSGSLSETDKTATGSDATIDNSLKATTQPCPGQGSASTESTKRSSETRKSAEASSRMNPDPCATSPSGSQAPSGSQMERR